VACGGVLGAGHSLQQQPEHDRRIFLIECRQSNECAIGQQALRPRSALPRLLFAPLAAELGLRLGDVVPEPLDPVFSGPRFGSRHRLSPSLDILP
jgi:hypothetical protein